MRGRRKRAKTTSSPVRTRSRRVESPFNFEENRISCSELKESERSFRVDTSTFEPGSFASRSSVHLIHEVVSKFDSQKRDLVKSIGFHGILDFPLIKQSNRQFALWLMSCVDEESHTIRIGDHINIGFSKVDVSRVFGIPASGKSILDDRVSSREAKNTVLERYLGPEFKDLRSIKIVQEVIEREYRSPISKSEADIFRVAFVVFVASNLLCPSAKYDYASIDYWKAIQDPDSISCYDWSEYVIHRLIEGVSKLRQDVASNIKFPNITGCSLFIQVLYLDSLNLGSVSLPHNSIPRISLFSYEKIRAMIAVDSNYIRFKKDDKDLPVVKLRDPSGCIYSWALEQVSEDDDSRIGCLLSIWESAVAMVHLLNVPMEAAGPLFVAAADFQNQVNCGLLVDGTQALKFMSVLVSIMIPFSRGFSYRSSYVSGNEISGFDGLGDVITKGVRLLSMPIRNKSKVVNRNGADHTNSINYQQRQCHNVKRANDHEASSSSGVCSHLEHGYLGDHVQRSLNSVMSSLDSLPHHMNVNLRVATAMSQFYSLIRRMKAPRDFDLNCFADDQLILAQSPLSHPDCNIESLPSPWSIGFAWSVIDVDKRHIMSKIASIEDDERLAIIHNSPKYIQVSASCLRHQFLGKSEMEIDLFDALVRCVRQGDDELYKDYGQLRWRIFLESDFMEAVMSGSFDLIGGSLREHMSLNSVTYDISKTKLIFFPALLQFSWICFVWDIEVNAIYVFDPSHSSPLPDGRIMAIERSCYLLKVAMQSLSRSVFIGWKHDASFADIRLITVSSPLVPRMNRTGVLCSYFLRCYDGVDLNPLPTQLDIDAISAKLAIEVFSLKQNSGLIPLSMS